MSRSLRAGIIGLGVGERHIAGYRAHPACEVVAVCDFDDDKRRRAHELYPDLRVAAEADEILEDPEIDIVSIASWDNYHHRQIVTALDRGKHVFVEKPLVLRPDEAADIRDRLVNRPGLKLSSNLILRRTPRFIDLKQRISTGELGRLFLVEGDYNYGRIHKLIEGWRGDIDGYSLVLGGGIHMVDLLTWLTGDRVIEVTAYGNRLATAGSKFDNFDLVVAILKFRSGMVGKIACNGGCVHPHFHLVNIYGTKATFINDLPTARLYYTRDPETPPQSIDGAYPGAAKGDMLASFVEAILRDRQPEVTADDIFRSLAVCFAIERSAHDGGSVAIESG